jgi:hypothetical protein
VMNVIVVVIGDVRIHRCPDFGVDLGVDHHPTAITRCFRSGLTSGHTSLFHKPPSRWSWAARTPWTEDTS